MLFSRNLFFTVKPSCKANPFTEMWPFKRGRNQYILIYIYIVKWPFQRGWYIRVASQKE